MVVVVGVKLVSFLMKIIWLNVNIWDRKLCECCPVSLLIEVSLSESVSDKWQSYLLSCRLDIWKTHPHFHSALHTKEVTHKHKHTHTNTNKQSQTQRNTNTLSTTLKCTLKVPSKSCLHYLHCARRQKWIRSFNSSAGRRDQKKRDKGGQCGF